MRHLRMGKTGSTWRSGWIASVGVGLVALASVLGTTGVAMAQGGDRDITVVLLEEPPTVEPCNIGTSTIGKVLKMNVIETLLDRNEKTGELLPRLATSWENPDPLTWIFHLREGVKFHDGADLNADAVIGSIARMMDERLDCVSRLGSFSNFTMTTTALDAMTVQIVTDKPEPILALKMTLMAISSPNMPEGVMSDNPIGTGPYSFVHKIPTQEVALTRFDGYWGDQPQVENVKFIYRADSAVQAAMVATGEADLAPTISQDDATTDMDHAYFNSETTRLRIQVDRDPLTDRRVREAINLAIDRDALKGTVLPADVVAATQLVPPGTVGYNSELTVWPYDPDRARELLAEAKADGLNVDAEIQMYARIGTFPRVQEMLEAIVAMLGDVGLNVKLNMQELAQNVLYTQKPLPEPVLPNLNLDQHDNAWGDAAFTAFFKYASGGAQSMLNDPVLDETIAKATVSTGPERQELWAKAFGIVGQEIIADVPLFHMVGYARVNPRINYEPSIKTNQSIEVATITFN